MKVYVHTAYLLHVSATHVAIFRELHYKEYIHRNITEVFGTNRGRDSVVGVATTLRAGRSEDRIPVGARFFAAVQTGPGAHPASYTMSTGSFSGVKRPGRGVDHPPPSSAEVKERVELYLYSSSGPSWPFIGWTLPYLFFWNQCTDIKY
jgi:hypothetical protein